MRHRDDSVSSSLRTLAVIAGVCIGLSALRLTPATTVVASSTAPADNGGSSPGGPGGAESPTQGGQANQGGAVRNTPSGSQAVAASRTQTPLAAKDCAAGKNPGATDVGVTGNTIKLASTIVTDGPGSSFLGSVRISMEALTKQVNSAGGICGRRINLELRNDSWKADVGSQYIRNFVESDKVFALAVMPSSEGLQAADPYIRQHGVPVVGTDGMLIHQYRNPWIWPVATSTISTMHIMAKNAFDRRSKEFGIVFDSRYHFGVEGAFAFDQAVKRMTGKDIDGYDPSLGTCSARFCGIPPDQPSYANEARTFNNACLNDPTKPRCDFIAYLLEPDTANSFIKEPRPADPVIGFGGAQPLFNRRFAEDCGVRCNYHFWVWTGYIPPIETLGALPAVSKYVNTIRGESASADVTNQFLEGGYVGMSLVIEALKQVGGNLTRDRLRQTLDGMTFDSGLSKPLSWTPANHFANVSARPFEIQFRESFNGWRIADDFLTDPWVGQDARTG